VTAALAALGERAHAAAQEMEFEPGKLSYRKSHFVHFVVPIAVPPDSHVSGGWAVGKRIDAPDMISDHLADVGKAAVEVRAPPAEKKESLP